MVDIDHAFFFEQDPPAGWQTSVDELLVKGKVADAEKAADAELKKARQAKDKSGEAAASHALAQVKIVGKKAAEALQFAEEAKTLCNGIGSSALLASVTLTLARVHLLRSNFDDASESAADALATFKEAGSKTGEAASLNMLALCELMRGNGDECLKSVEDSFKIFDKVNSLRGKASALHTKSMLMTAAGRKAEGITIAQEAASLLQESGDDYRYAAALLATTDSAIQSSDFSEAIESSSASLAIFEKHGDKAMQADVLIDIVNYCFKIEDFAVGIETADKTIKLCKEIGDAKRQAQALFSAAQLKRAKLSSGGLAWPPKKGVSAEDLDDLQSSADEAVKLFSQVGDGEGEAGARFELAHCFLARGELSAGNQEVSKAQRLFAAGGDSLGECISAVVSSQVQYKLGEKDFAYNTIDKALQLAQDAAHEYLERVCLQFKTQLESERKAARGEDKESKKGPAAPPPGEMGGGITAAVYGLCIRRAMWMGDNHGEHMFDDPRQLSGLEMMLGQRYTFYRNRPPPGQELDLDACLRAWAEPAKRPVVKARADAGKAAPAKVKSTLGGVCRKPRLPPMAVQVPRQNPSKAVGSDLLGGRMEGVPEEVHADMIALASSGDIPVTKPADRAVSITKKPSFYGDPLFRDALRFGYIHPSSAAPRGMKWKSVRAGAFKLVSV
jgi:tetratricopeptide (TPR) repeat protein